MEEPDPWLDTVRDDARGRRTSARSPEPMAPSMSKASIVMPDDVGNQFDRFVDEMNDDANQTGSPDSARPAATWRWQPSSSLRRTRRSGFPASRHNCEPQATWPTALTFCCLTKEVP